MRTILAIIPARGGSKGVPGKNKRMFCGKPLLAWTIVKALRLGVARCIVSTDSEEIAAIAREHGAETPFLRPASLSDDKATLLQVMNHALRFFDDRGEHFGAVLSLQATTPLLRLESIQAGIEVFHATGAACVVSVSEIRQGHPVLAKKRLSDGRLQDYSEWPEDLPRYPRQTREPAFYANGGFFLRDRSLVEAMDSRTNGFGDFPLSVLVTPLESVNIDEPIDFTMAELLFAEELAR
jgi:CMP-N-acetylneuraminic acid synthetase